MFLCFLKDKTYSSKAIFNPYLNKIILQNKHGMLNVGIYIQSPLLQTTLEAPRNFIFPRGQRNGFVVSFFPGFPLLLFKPLLNENLYCQEKNQQYKLGNYISNVTAVLSGALKALLITKCYSESLYALRVNHRKLLLFHN